MKWALSGAVAIGLLLAARVLLPSSAFQIQGRVVDLDGRPLSGASIQFSGGAEARSGSDGLFAMRSETEGGWVSVRLDGYLSRTRAARDGHQTVVRLTPDDGRTVRLLFGGDVMFGRRYYVGDDGRTDGALLARGAGVEKHLRLLDGVAPLLADADLSIVNLESPLIADPWYDPTGPRPTQFHATKEFVFGSMPAAAVALHRAGIDIVGLGNNHVYDAGEAGIQSTRSALLAAGYQASDLAGFGTSADAAWQPAIRRIGDQTIAVLACTSITGDEHAVTYVAGPAKGGAARCEPERLAAEVRAARSRAELVVVMIHGGYEYVREPSPQIASLSAVARAAGAALIVNSHPHVVGGLDWEAGQLTAWTMGNLVFDQTVWPTFESYVLRVDVRDGLVVNAYLEPIMITNYRPVGVVAEDADWVARGALERSSGPWALDDGAMTLDPAGHARGRADAPEATGDLRTGAIVRLGDSCAASPTLAPGTLVGRDELWTGSFEDEDVDGSIAGGALWNVTADNPSRRITSSASDGSFGVRLQRTGANVSSVVLTPQHRVLVTGGQRLTFLASLRGTPEARLSLDLGWYNDLKGASVARSSVVLPVGADWKSVRVDVVVPQNAISVGVYLAVAPPSGPTHSWVDVDAVRLIAWESPGDGPACEFLLLGDASQVPVLQRVSLPGTVADRGATVIVTEEPIRAAALLRLPAGAWSSTLPGED